MTDLRTAAKQALEALEDMLGWQSLAPQTIQEAAKGRAAALRAALAEYYCDTHCTWADHAPECPLAEPVQEPVQEPVAWYHVPYPNNGISPMVSLSKHHEPSMYGAAVPLYLSPIMEPKIKTPKEEPVAWMDIDENGNRLTVRQWSDGNREEVPLYTAPPQRKPLTTEEVEQLWAQSSWQGRANIGFARAIEKAHGIGV